MGNSGNATHQINITKVVYVKIWPSGHQRLIRCHRSPGFLTEFTCVWVTGNAPLQFGIKDGLPSTATDVACTDHTGNEPIAPMWMRHLGESANLIYDAVIVSIEWWLCNYGCTDSCRHWLSTRGLISPDTSQRYRIKGESIATSGTIKHSSGATEKSAAIVLIGNHAGFCIATGQR